MRIEGGVNKEMEGGGDERERRRWGLLHFFRVVWAWKMSTI